MLPLWEQWQWRSDLYSPKPQHYWNLTIRLFCIIFKTLIGRGWSYPSAEVQSVPIGYFMSRGLGFAFIVRSCLQFSFSCFLKVFFLHTVLSNTNNFKQIYLIRRWDPSRYYHARWEPTWLVMATKRYICFCLPPDRIWHKVKWPEGQIIVGIREREGRARALLVYGGHRPT